MPQITNRGERWRACDRCGFDYPFSQLRREPGSGAVVCITFVKCFRRNPDYENALREHLIGEDEDFGMIYPAGDGD